MEKQANKKPKKNNQKKPTKKTKQNQTNRKTLKPTTTKTHKKSQEKKVIGLGFGVESSRIFGNYLRKNA